MTRPLWTRTDRPEPDPCEALNPLISPYADGMASPDEAARVEGHLPSCPACRQSLLWMQATRRALATRPIVLPPPDLRARIAQAIAASDAAPVSLRPARTFTLRPAYAAAASLSAVAAVMAGYGLLHHPTPSVQPVIPAVKVAAVPRVESPASKPVLPKATPVKRPVTPRPLVAQAEPVKTHSASPLVARVLEDGPDTLAPDARPLPEPARAVTPDVTPRETLVVKVKPSPRVMLKKKPLVTPSQKLMASRLKPKPVEDKVPSVMTPVPTPSSEKVAELPKETPAPVAVGVGPATITSEPPAPVRTASASPDLLGAVREHVGRMRTVAFTHTSVSIRGAAYALNTAVVDRTPTLPITSGDLQH